ncbi:chitinase C-terminal domain-containing protein [Streptomyces sp. G35A]
MPSPSRTGAGPALPALAAAVAGLLLAGLPATVPHAADQESCRPDGLYRTPGADVPYCSVYDSAGREKTGADHQRRVIGYFTGGRTGKDGRPAYLASDIPWDRITHINYAFAHVDKGNELSVGPDGATNPATGTTWPGVAGAEMDPRLPHRGHFNLLNKFKKQHPDVRTLISVGGRAETGGYFDEGGDRVDSGGSHAMATNADGSVNRAGIDTFADSAVDFVRTYGFNGADIDHEYPTTMYEAFRSASPYGATRATTGMPSEALDIGVDFGRFPPGDSNYPISPKPRITNNTSSALPGGTEFRFDYATSAPGNAKDQSGRGTTVIRSDHAGGNVGGLKGDYHRVSLKLPAWQSLAPGASVELDFVYHLPVSTPSNWTVTSGGRTYALTGDLARGTAGAEPGPGTPTEPTTPPGPVARSGWSPPPPPRWWSARGWP